MPCTIRWSALLFATALALAGGGACGAGTASPSGGLLGSGGATTARVAGAAETTPSLGSPPTTATTSTVESGVDGGASAAAPDASSPAAAADASPQNTSAAAGPDAGPSPDSPACRAEIQRHQEYDRLIQRARACGRDADCSVELPANLCSKCRAMVSSTSPLVGRLRALEGQSAAGKVCAQHSCKTTYYCGPVAWAKCRRGRCETTTYDAHPECGSPSPMPFRW